MAVNFSLLNHSTIVRIINTTKYDKSRYFPAFEDV